MPEKLDYKKKYKDLYLPKSEPIAITVPNMLFLMVEGKGNPNIVEGEYQKAVEALYSLTYTIKMSKMSGKQPEGYFDYVVPPLEGLWWVNDHSEVEFKNKEKYCWISMIRQPEFVTEDIFEWAKKEVKRKKPQVDTSKVMLKFFEEGLCVQAMHIGPYEKEDTTIKKIEKYIHENNLSNDFNAILEDKMIRRHHEIYLNDPTKTASEKMKTVIRHPVKKID